MTELLLTEQEIETLAAEGLSRDIKNFVQRAVKLIDSKDFDDVTREWYKGVFIDALAGKLPLWGSNQFRTFSYPTWEADRYVDVPTVG